MELCHGTRVLSCLPPCAACKSRKDVGLQPRNQQFARVARPHGYAGRHAPVLRPLPESCPARWMQQGIPFIDKGKVDGYELLE